MILRIFSLIAIFWVLGSCSGSKKVNSEEADKKGEIDTYVAPVLTSNVNIHYKINKKSLVDTFNFVIDELSKVPMVFPEYEVKTQIKRNGNVNLEIAGKEILTTLPLDVEVDKKTFLANVKANGTLHLTFLTKFDITKDWTLTTKTVMTQHKWIKTPKIDLGVINLPIESLSNMILTKSKTDLEKSIDQSIKETYNLKAIIEELSKFMLTPTKLNEEFGGWMYMIADSAMFSPAINTATYTEGKISLKTKMHISSQAPKTNAVAVPPFAWKSTVPDTSILKFILELEYDYLTAIARKNFIGQVLNDGNKNIEVVDIEVGKRNGKLEVTATTKGDFNGKLSVMGVPAYDKSTAKIYCKDIDVKVKTGNVLYAAAAWLLKGKMKTELDKMLTFNVKEKMHDIQNLVDTQVNDYNKQYSTETKIQIGDIDFDQILLRPDRTNVIVSVKTKITTTLNNLGLFR